MPAPTQHLVRPTGARWPRRAAGLGLLAAALLLGGCAGVIRLDNEVRSQADWPLGPNAIVQRPASGDRYRFERRLSQQAQPAQQAALEGLARDALARVGLRPEDPAGPAPRWSVELAARSIRLPYPPWDEPARANLSIGIGLGHVGRHGSIGLGLPLFPYPATPYYQRELTLLLREARSARVVYETSARHDGPWADSPTLWAALLDAALQGFPQPPTGPRQVVIEVPR